jgi:hypothetical protein
MLRDNPGTLVGTRGRRVDPSFASKDEAVERFAAWRDVIARSPSLLPSTGDGGVWVDSAFFAYFLLLASSTALNEHSRERGM